MWRELLAFMTKLLSCDPLIVTKKRGYHVIEPVMRFDINTILVAIFQLTWKQIEVRGVLSGFMFHQTTNSKSSSSSSKKAHPLLIAKA